MNPVVEEMQLILQDNELAHYGMPRRSGRYPWGSGDEGYQRNIDFLGRYEKLKKQGLSEKEIAAEMGMFDEKGNPSTGKLRLEKRYCNDERRIYQIQTAKRMKEKEGMGNTEIGRALDIPESTVRSLLDPHSEMRTMKARATAEFIKQRIDAAAAKDPHGKGMIDIGSGTDIELSAAMDLNISKEKLTEALYILERQGYHVYKGGVPQPTNPGQQTNQKVICSPGTQHKEIYEFDRVRALNEDQYISRDGGDTFEKKFYYPESLSSKRLKIRYTDEAGPDGATGNDKDGIVELRRGVADLSLGESRYSQVRIMVDGTHYIKGMAVYSDDMPDGVDVIFNTNKSKDTPALGPKDHTVLKPIKGDPDNPFGSLIKDADQGGQYHYDPKTGKRCVASDPNAKLGLINKRADEGDWDEWSNALPSQFLGKQSKTLAKKQLNLAKADKQQQYDEICSLTNPTIKKHLLKDFANTCDAAAVHLKAAALPGQKYHVIVPINTLKDTEVYAPNYENGTKLALIRYPHGGTFEIPILTVNNKNKLGKTIIGDTSIDAVGINKKIADRLSGADFDGDTVMAIPTHDPMGKVKIKSKDLTGPLKELESFDPKMAYGTEAREDGYYNAAGQKIRPMTKKNTQTQMGVISNLITDMTLGGASDDQLVRAVKHSMVVIDAEKHKLDYKSSEIENNIAALKREWQRTVDENGKEHVGGASTILSRAKGEYSVEKRQGSPYINDKNSTDPRHPYDPTRPEGALIYKTADDANRLRPVRTINKKTGVVTLTDNDTGAKIKYDPSNEDERNRYQPIKKVNKETGEVTYVSKSGEYSYKLEGRTQKSTRMAETDDAYTLVSDAQHPMELLYADYANSMKAMANQARKELLSTGKIAYDAKAKAVYQKEVDSLNAKLNDAEKNKPRERAALRIANAEVAAKKQADPSMEPGDIKKAKQQAVSRARQAVGSASRRERNIDITDREWEAIQAGAVSENTLVRILNNTDVDKLKQRAMPRTTATVSQAKINTIKAMAASNYTLEQIAKKTGLSTSAVSKYLKGK